MLQLATPPARPRPAVLASVGLHLAAVSAFAFGPLLAFPELPGWRGEVWTVTQPDLSVLRDVRRVDLRDRTPRPARERAGGGLPAESRGAGGHRPTREVTQPGPIPEDLPSTLPSESAGDSGVDGGVDDGTPAEPGSGFGDGFGDGDGDGPIDVRGGAVPPDIVLPVPLETPMPAYGDVARLARAEGAVVLSATIDSDGRVVDVSVEGAANPLLVRSAVEAVSRWRYVPARIGARPVAVILRVTLTFRLR